MLVICVEAGLSLDQATARTAEELKQSQPILSDELTVVALEQRAGSVRADAWKHLADRTGIDVVRNLVSMLVQSEQFGTSIAKTLRVHSDTLRTKRVQEIEEKAAKLSVKLSLPSGSFHFPLSVRCGLRTGSDSDGRLVQISVWSLKKGDIQMDTPTIIRIVSGVLFAVVLVILIQRRRTQVK